MLHWKAFSADTINIGEINKSSKTFVAPIEPVIRIQTPQVSVISSLVDEHGAALPCAHIKLPAPFLAKMQDVETRVLNHCIAHKSDWLKRDVEDEFVRHSFKSFVKDSALKVLIPEECLFFDFERKECDRENMTNARAILELNRVIFGKTEFGAMWRVVQLQSIKETVCLIVDDLLEDPQFEDDFDVHEFE